MAKIDKIGASVVYNWSERVALLQFVNPKCHKIVAPSAEDNGQNMRIVTGFVQEALQSNSPHFQVCVPSVPSRTTLL